MRSARGQVWPVPARPQRRGRRRNSTSTRRLNGGEAGGDLNAEIRRLTEDKYFDIGPMQALLGVRPIELEAGLARSNLGLPS